MSITNQISILGASSDLGKALTYCFAREATHMILSARQTEQLRPLQQDLLVQEVCSSVELLELDVAAFEPDMLRLVAARTDVLILTIGYLGDEQKALHDYEEAQRIIQLNYAALVPILNIFANEMEKRGKGTIIAISSVAGDRGRQSNAHYGSAKAGLTAFLSGLRNRMYGKGIRVMTVKPGFMATKMTAHLELPALLTISPEKAARKIYNGYRWQQSVLYIGGKWRWIMWIIRSIPEGIFKRLKL